MEEGEGNTIKYFIRSTDNTGIWIDQIPASYCYKFMTLATALWLCKIKSLLSRKTHLGGENQRIEGLRCAELTHKRFRKKITRLSAQQVSGLLQRPHNSPRLSGPACLAQQPEPTWRGSQLKYLRAWAGSSFRAESSRRQQSFVLPGPLGTLRPPTALGLDFHRRGQDFWERERIGLRYERPGLEAES